jgi:formylglycine-generating enzyme required for sulfatase activity
MTSTFLRVQKIRVYLSSPGDVAEERNQARAVLGKLQKEPPFADRLLIEEVSWDDPENPVPLDASQDPQQSINRARGKPSDCDVVVVILWSRLGTPMPANECKPDGSPYRSGTEWEFGNALAGAKEAGRPTVWLYRRDEEPTVPLRHPNRDDIIRQADLVDIFFDELKNPDGSLPHGFTSYSKPADFRGLLEQHLRQWLGNHLRMPSETRVGRESNAEGQPTLDLPELPRYREAALSLHGSLSIAGFKTKARVPIRLDELYVPLQAMLDSRFSGGCEFADAKDAEDRLRPHGANEIPLIEAFRAASERNRRGLVILGDPGSGKTTHLKRLLLACLKTGPESLGLPAGTIPVFLPLRNLEDLNAGAEAFIARALDNRNLGMPEGFGKALLERGHLLLLFDGLDEVADPERRARVSDWIEDVARHRPNCLAVVTCRFAGYGEAVRLSADFLELHLRPLTPGQSDTFIRNWYRVVKTSQAPGPAALAEAAEEAERLIVRLREPDFRSARMAEMTRNPLLLANLCLVHYDRKGILPKGRDELYDECIEVLLELWRRDKRLSVSVSAQVGRALLGPVALWLHGQEGRTRASLGELTPVLESAIEREKWPGDAAAFLRAVRDESGLLTGWGKDHYGFMHLGFQEYLAAMEIRRQVLTDLVAGRPPAALVELASHYVDSFWQEVILLLLAQGDPPLFEPFMQAALLHPDFDAADELTRFILEEASGVSAEPFKRYLRDRQPPTATEWTAGWMAARYIEALTSPEEWIAFFQTLPDTTWAAMSVSSGGIGEWLKQGKSSAALVQSSRNGGVELVTISAGRFLMGSPSGVGYDHEHPQHEVNVHRFLLGRYPVTNAEYRRYLEANPDGKEPKYWGDRRFNQDHQPVVGVDWDDALRFCAWAGGRLPSEAEWEYACRAGTATKFHWGDDEASAVEFAWFGDDGNNGVTHPVGEKRPNLWGLHDLTGNVYEWIQDAWHDSYEGAPVDGSAWTEGDDSRRVLRGGSWVTNPGTLRSANRHWDTLEGRFSDLGFRLAQNL